MKSAATNFHHLRQMSVLILVVALGAANLALAVEPESPEAAGPRSSYVAHVLVADEPGEGDFLDPNLVNAWGLAASASGPWWVADNETDKSTLYDGSGVQQMLIVDVHNAPTGIVFNGGAGFVVTTPPSGSAKFLFAGEDGTIRAWRPAAPTTTDVVVDSSAQQAIYKGLAIDSTTAGTRLYAADFHNARVDVFDASFAPLNLPGAFQDRKIPKHFAPFGIQVIGTTVYVTYAKQDRDAEDEIAGKGQGVVNAYDLNGALLGRVASHGLLNAPWGVALAPADFGEFSGDLLIGNFGDGRITAYDPVRFKQKGQLRDSHHKALEVDGLWGIAFGNGASSGPTNTLYFAAGPEDETHGYFGSIVMEKQAPRMEITE